MTATNLERDSVIDPDIATFVAAILDGSAEQSAATPIPHDERRARAAMLRARWTEGGPVMARVREFRTEGTPAVRVRFYEPQAAASEPQPAMMYIHGGGWVLFSLDTHDRLMREYAARAGVIVIGVDYSLSPEARYPVALNEVVTAVDWVRDNAAQLGVDSARIAIGGDSAGANLSLATALVLRERGEGDALAAMVFNYGFFGDDFDTESQRSHGGEGKLLTTAELEDYLVAYLGEGASRDDPLALPALAALHDLPPSLHVIADCDPLADGDRALAEAMKAAGNRVERREYAGATHSFLEAVAISKLADQAFEDTARWLRDVLATAGQATR